jgi:predicted hydrolase (HD superfamily)
VTLTREEAWQQMLAWTDSASLRSHMRAVEVVMTAAAYQYGRGAEDEVTFAVAGILHDADYEKWPEEHPNRIVAWLRERDEDELAHAIAAHYTIWGVPCESALDKALLACDELTGFIIACCLVRPEGITTLTPRSVKKRLKSARFAAKVDRNEVRIGAEQLGVEIGEHIQFIIDALKPHADELGIGARPAG